MFWRVVFKKGRLSHASFIPSDNVWHIHRTGPLKLRYLSTPRATDGSLSEVPEKIKTSLSSFSLRSIVADIIC